MAPKSIPVISVAGNHRQVGQQIGEHMKLQIQRMVARLRDNLPPGVAWKDMLLKGELCLAHSRAAYPMFVEELGGIAEASGLPFEEIFLAVCEELWEPAAWHTGTPTLSRGCTDLAARGQATVDGATLVAHNNDLPAEVEDNLVIIKVRARNEPEFLAVSTGGLGFSAGFNAAGISMTGNAMSCSDIRPGVPRMLIARAILAAKRLGEAMDACLLPLRASNYNNVIADTSGEVYSMEGSATDCEPIYIDENVMVHANHYISQPMRRFEANRNYIGGSILRHNRALRLLRENYGRLTPEVLQKLLSDHANYPASICKHEGATVTVFAIIIKVNELKAWIGQGRPCQTCWCEHTLEPWPGAPPGEMV